MKGKLTACSMCEGLVSSKCWSPVCWSCWGTRVWHWAVNGTWPHLSAGCLSLAPGKVCSPPLCSVKSSYIVWLLLESEPTSPAFWVRCLWEELSQGHRGTFQLSLGHIFSSDSRSDFFSDSSPTQWVLCSQTLHPFYQTGRTGSLISFKKRYSSLINWRVIAWNPSLQ